MPQNKHAFIRYRAIDRCLGNQRVRYTAALIHEKVNEVLENYRLDTKGISRAQFYADIEFMESADGWNVDIERRKEGRNRYWRYAEDGFSINNMPLNELEISQLQEALSVLSQFKGMPQFEWMEEVVAKLKQDIKPEQQQTIVSFDSNQYLKGIEWLGAIYNAVLYKKVLDIGYRPFGAKEAQEVIFHPYYIKQYNNRWFAFGHCAADGRPIRNLALDRIETLEERADGYVPNTGTDFESYFEDIIGVTRPEGELLQKVELLISAERAGYVITKPFHDSQKSREGQDGLHITLEVIPNRELIQLILSFGNQIQVLSPMSLRDQVKEILQIALERYD